MAQVAGRVNWAEDEEDSAPALPQNEIIKNSDRTETHISYHIREDGKKVKTTRIIKRTKITQTVNPQVAERRQWAKFGAAAKDPVGPQSDTTTVGEDIQVHPRAGYKAQEAPEQAALAQLEDTRKQALAKASVKCRICSGDHFTARCPYKATMAPEGEPGIGDPVPDPMAEPAGAAGGPRKYVPPAQRLGLTSGDKMGGRYERDELATLRVTNVSEYAEEQELREMFERWGRVTRVFLAKDRETGRAKGFAFVSFADRSDAAMACAKMDGYGYNNLILRVEFAKKAT